MNIYERIYNIITEAMSAKAHGAGIEKAELPRVKKTISKKIAAKWNTSQEGIAQSRGAAAETLRAKRLARVERGRPIRQAVAQRTDGGEEVVDVAGREPGISPTGKKKI